MVLRTICPARLLCPCNHVLAYHHHTTGGHFRDRTRETDASRYNTAPIRHLAKSGHIRGRMARQMPLATTQLRSGISRKADTLGAAFSTQLPLVRPWLKSLGGLLASRWHMSVERGYAWRRYARSAERESFLGESRYSPPRSGI